MKQHVTFNVLNILKKTWNIATKSNLSFLCKCIDIWRDTQKPSLRVIKTPMVTLTPNLLLQAICVYSGNYFNLYNPMAIDEDLEKIRFLFSTLWLSLIKLLNIKKQKQCWKIKIQTGFLNLIVKALWLMSVFIVLQKRQLKSSYNG